MPKMMMIRVIVVAIISLGGGTTTRWSFYCHGATVVVERDAVASTYFGDDDDDGHRNDDDGHADHDDQYCEYAGEIVLSHPMSVFRDDKHYVLGSQMLESAHMSIDEINKWPNCGVQLAGSRDDKRGGNGNASESNMNDDAFLQRQKKNYSLHLITYGDESSKNKTAEIGRKIAADNRTDFMLAGYSSSLTAFLTPIAEEHKRICVTGGSSRTSVHADRDYVFGLLPPSGMYLENAFRGLRRVGATTVAYLDETGVQSCTGTPDMASKFNMTLLAGVTLPEASPLETFEEVARNMSLLDPDVMITCIRTTVDTWNTAMRSVGWNPKAQVYTLVLGTPEFEEALGWGDLRYTMGVSSWDKVLPPIPDGATGFTPSEFYDAFTKQAFRPPAYQHVSQSAAVSVLVQAIQRAGTFTNLTERVKQELATGYFPTVYGNVSFDENGQSAVPFLLMQYDDNGTLHVLQPEDRVSTDFEMVYPMPSWDNRDCVSQSTCLLNGTCTANGTCECPPPMISVGGAGATAGCVPPPEQLYAAAGFGAAALSAIVVPTVVVIVLVGAALFVYYQKKKQENDAVWQVKREELVFGDPPEIIGRGTFGLVLLAEYRGTQVAVKRVLPPKKSLKKSSALRGKLPKSSTHHDDSYSDSAFDDDDYYDEDETKKSNAKKKAAMGSWAGLGMTSVDTTILATSGYSKSVKSGEGGGRSVSSSGMSSGYSVSSYSSGTHTSRSGYHGGGGGTASSIMSGATSKFKSLTKKKGSREAALHRKLKADFIEEMRYVSKLRHPCITTVMGAVISQTDEPLMIMEYMDHGSLHGLLHNETMLLEGDIILPLLRDVSQGCRFLHASVPQTIHGDLKAANILVDTKFRAKVADFGLSQKKRIGGGGGGDSSSGGATGTPFWMAPELLRGESGNTAASDVYSFGIILYEVFSRRDPYDDEDDDELDAREILRQIKDPDINKRPPVPPNCPPQMAALMSDCLVANPDERPSFEEVDKRLQRCQAEKATAELSAPGGKLARTNKTTVSLFDIFPKHVAEALRDGKQVEPEHRETVTIFFPDIVGFTNLSSTLDPRKVANMLDRLYQKFDKLSQEHDIFKVETIGDAYMAVTNLVKDQPDDHVKRIAEFAIAAVRASNETLVDTSDPDKGYVNIRVGFHTGPVVADVVGTRNPRYCLFGDSVNVASRMESNSRPNRIHCSKSAATLLKKQYPQMPLKSRGMIQVKGKGEMDTYWVNEGVGAVKSVALKKKPEEQNLAAAAETAAPQIIPQQQQPPPAIQQRQQQEQAPPPPSTAETGPAAAAGATTATECSSSTCDTLFHGEGGDDHHHISADTDAALEVEPSPPPPPPPPPAGAALATGDSVVVGSQARSKMRDIEAALREKFDVSVMHDAALEESTNHSNGTINL